MALAIRSHSGDSSNWADWTMWQYTDGALGQPPYEVPGIGRCDRDMFNGTESELRVLWTLTSAAQAP